MKVLTPAYGRDFKSAREARENYLSGKDWKIQPQGQYCSCHDFPNEMVELRYKKLRFATLVAYEPK